MHGSLARFDRSSCSWRTCQGSLLPGERWTPFSGRWPRSGTMRCGIAYPRQPSAPLTGGTGSGAWPTPTVGDSKSARNSTARRQRIPPTGIHAGHTLTDAVTMWPTPNVPNGGRRVPKGATIKGGTTPTAYYKGKKCQVGLEQAVAWWPTPTASPRDANPKRFMRGNPNLAGCVAKFATPNAADATGMHGGGQGRSLRTDVGGQLNPPWVAWLMGFPIGWTDSEPLATQSFPQWSDAFLRV